MLDNRRERTYLSGPVKIKRRNEHEDLKVVDEYYEVDSEEGLLLES